MAEESSCSKLKKLARSSFKTVFPPINKQSLLYHYVPLSGAICHTAYHVHVVSPNFILKYNFLIFLFSKNIKCFRKFPVWNLAISNSLLFNAKLGIGKRKS